MTPIGTFFERLDVSVERHPRAFAVVGIAVLLSLFSGAYYMSGSLLTALVFLAASPVLLMVALAMAGMIVLIPLVLMDVIAGKLADRGWSYWFAFGCLTPLGFLHSIFMIYLIDWALGSIGVLFP